MILEPHENDNNWELVEGYASRQKSRTIAGLRFYRKYGRFPRWPKHFHKSTASYSLKQFKKDTDKLKVEKGNFNT